MNVTVKIRDTAISAITYIGINDKARSEDGPAIIDYIRGSIGTDSSTVVDASSIIASINAFACGKSYCFSFDPLKNLISITKKLREGLKIIEVEPPQNFPDSKLSH